MPPEVDTTQDVEGLVRRVEEALRSTEGPDTPDDASRKESLALRVRGWFLEAVNHPFWRDYIKNAKEDEEYYIGGEGQWSVDGSRDDLQRLKAQKRAHVSINHIASVVDVLTGFERQNKYDIKATPEGNEDADEANILSMILKWVQDQADVGEIESENFEDGLISGMACQKVGVDWLQSEDPQGRIEVTKLKPGEEVLWDPHWKRFDVQDARYFLEFRWAFLDDLVAEFPDDEDEIRAAVMAVQTAFQGQMNTGNVTTDGLQPGRSGAYGSVSDHPMENLENEMLFYDPEQGQILVVEAWYRDYSTVYVAKNKETGAIKSFTKREDAVAYQAADPSRWQVLERRIRKIRRGIVLPSTYQTLEEGPTPYENDDAAYPYCPYIAKKRRNVAYGIVRNLKDPQLVENKRISQIMDILGRYGNLRPMVPKGALENPASLSDYYSNEPIIYDPNKGTPSWFSPPLAELARVLTEMALQSKLNIREISGVNTDLLGIKGDTVSGIAIARRQSQGQTIATVYFDNLKRQRKGVGQRLARRIQQVFTNEQVIRLIDPNTGEPISLLLNPRDAKDLSDERYKEYVVEKMLQDGTRPKILRDLTALKYDITISDSPSTPTARNLALLALMEVVGKVPQVLPVVVDKIFELADVPDRHELVRRIRAMQQPPEQPGQGGGIPAGPVHPGGPGASAAGAGPTAPALPGPPAVVQRPPTAAQVQPNVAKVALGNPSPTGAPPSAGAVGR